MHYNKMDESVKASEDSVILVGDSTIDNTQDKEDADSSCFIIDVEPNLNPEEEKSFYKYSSQCNQEATSDSGTVLPGCDENNKNSANDLSASCENNVREIVVDSSSSCSEDVSSSMKSSNSSSTSSSSCEDDPTSKSTESVQKRVKIASQQVEMFNDIVNKMKNDGFFSSNKRRFEDSCHNTKRFAHDVGEARPESWNSFKKCLGASPPKKNTSKNLKNAQHLASKNLLNKQGKNQSNNDLGCVNVDDSDSDVEFIDSFNPSDRLIELSDGEESVILESTCEALIPLPIIELPFGKKKKKSKQATAKNRGKTEIKKKKTKQIKRKEKLKRAKEAKESESQGKETKSTEKGPLRPIVVDGCNVGYGHSKVGMFSVEGIKICYDYFKERGHEVKVFVPQFKLFSPKTSNNMMLKQMEKDGIVIFTPGRKVDGKSIYSYDDRFIVEYATLKGAIVVTRDNYRDLYAEKEEFRETIRDRLLQYTFVDDLIMFPDDPLGRTGPRLNDFLRFPLSQTDSTQKQNEPSTSKS